MVRVLFVCLGNICRSPMAEAVFRDLVKKRSLEEQFAIDSAGLGGWHVGEEPHDGTQRVLKKQGVDYGEIRARQFRQQDFGAFEYILVMDEQNLRDIEKLRDRTNKPVFRLMDFAPDFDCRNVPDPFFDGRFEEVYEMVKAGCEGLLRYVLEHETERIEA